MTLVVSPYHITLQELPAMTASLLGSRLITYLPVPEQIDRASVRRAMGTSPRYFRLLESWRWAAPLFRAGVICSLDGPARGTPTRAGSAPHPTPTDPLLCVRHADTRLGTDARYNELRAFRHASLFSPERTYLDTVAADMLKAGPDPGVCVPIAAGLDAFAAARGFVVVRSGGAPAPRAGTPGTSLAQRAEGVLGETVLSFSMPILSAADGDSILDVRQELHQELDQLRESLNDALLEARATASTPADAINTPPADEPLASARSSSGDIVSSQAIVREAAQQYTRAFDVLAKDMLGADDQRGRRITGCTVSVVCKRMSVDAAFVSSVAALRQAGARGGPPTPQSARRGVQEPARAPTQTMLTMVITQMNVRPPRVAGARNAAQSRH